MDSRCGGAGDSHHGCAVDKSAAAVTCCHVSSQHIIEFVLPLQLRKLWIKNGGPKRWNKLFILGKINNRKLHCFSDPLQSAYIIKTLWCSCWSHILVISVFLCFISEIKTPFANSRNKQLQNTPSERGKQVLCHCKSSMLYTGCPLPTKVSQDEISSDYQFGETVSWRKTCT